MNFPTAVKDIKLLRNICKKVLENPNNERYKNLNLSKLQQKFMECHKSIDVLFIAGFIKSDDGARLLFHSNQLLKLKQIYQALQSISIPNGDEQTLKNLEELISSLKSDISNQSENNLQHFLRTSNLYNNISLVAFDCDLKKCLCFKIICDVLKNYQVHILENMKKVKIKELNIFDSIYSKIGNNYNNVDLLDDFNHLMLHHSHEFEDIYERINEISFSREGCDLSNCVARRRNYRDRSEETKHENLTYELYSNNEDIMEQQLLDRIHCYFLHTFDIGYKLTESEKLLIMYDETKEEQKTNDEVNMLNYHQLARIHHIITSKRNQNRNIIGFDRIYTGNKKKYSTTDLENEYSFGYRFFYWDHYRDNANVVDHDLAILNVTQEAANQGYTLCDWFITKKYCNLKTELLTNKICVISQSEWNLLRRKAQIHIQTDKVKSIYCPRIATARIFGMFYGQPMSEKHLVAMMVYCNYDELQHKFSETFRKLDLYESDERLKARHRNYYFLGKLLRECVECFGMEAPDEYYLRLYHGVTAKFTFSSMFACIKGPFSTSKDYAVAVNFCHNKGMVLQLKLDITNSWRFKMDDGSDAAFRLTCLDLSWISDYANEQEVFFIGGLNPFIFEAIIEASTGGNYEKYITAIRQMTFGMTGGIMAPIDSDTLPNPTSQELQIIYRLLCHELWKYNPDHKQAIEFKSCPKYINDILYSHCNKIRMINVFDKVNKVNDKFFRYDNGWIKPDLYAIIFPNVETISFTALNKDISLLKDTFIYESILKFIHRNQAINLKGMNIIFDLAHKDQIENIVNSYKTRFDQYGWNILVISKKLSNLQHSINLEQIMQQNPEILWLWNSDPQWRQEMRNMMNAMGLPMFNPNNPSAFGIASIEIMKKEYNPMK